MRAYYETFSIDELEEKIGTGCLEVTDDLIYYLEEKSKAASFSTFMDYNIRDVELVELLEKKLEMIKQAMTVAYLAKINFQDVFGTIVPWDAIIHNHLLAHNTVVPPKKAPDGVREDFEGGYVKEVTPGCYDWIITLDFASLYPHIIMTWNISPETILGVLDRDMTVDDLLDGKLKQFDALMREQNVAVAGNTAYYRKDIRGVIPVLMDEYYQRRKVVKKQMLKEMELYEETKDEAHQALASKLNNIQFAIKTLLASAYGSISNEWFRFFDIRNGAAITACGRLADRWVARDVNKLLNKLCETEGHDFILAADTDSLIVHLEPVLKKMGVLGKPTKDIVALVDRMGKEIINPAVARSCERLGAYVNCYEQRLSMKREKIAQRGIWRKKKNYILSVWDEEGVRYSEPELKMTGIEAVKTNTPQVCRDAIKHCLKLMMTGTEAEFRTYAQDFWLRFQEMTYDEIASPSGVNNLEKYYDKNLGAKKGTPMHVRASLAFNRLIKERNLEGKVPEIHSGDKIKFCPLKSPNPIGYPVIATSTTIPPSFAIDNYLDRDMQFRKKFLDPLSAFVDSMDWLFEEKPALDFSLL